MNEFYHFILSNDSYNCCKDSYKQNLNLILMYYQYERVLLRHIFMQCYINQK